MKKLIVILLFVSMLLLLTACGNKTEKLAKKLTDEAVPAEIKTSENLLMASVTIPDYSTYMLEVWEEAEEKSKDLEEFEEVLYSLVSERIKDEHDTVVHNVSVELVYLDAEKSKWSDKELTEAARKKAFEIELNEFCAEIISMQDFDIDPEVSYED